MQHLHRQARWCYWREVFVRAGAHGCEVGGEGGKGTCGGQRFEFRPAQGGTKGRGGMRGDYWSQGLVWARGGTLIQQQIPPSCITGFHRVQGNWCGGGRRPQTIMTQRGKGGERPVQGRRALQRVLLTRM